MVEVNGCLQILDFSFPVLVRYRVERLKRSFMSTRQFSSKQLRFNHQANPFPMACLQSFRRFCYRTEAVAGVRCENIRGSNSRPGGLGLISDWRRFAFTKPDIWRWQISSIHQDNLITCVVITPTGGETVPSYLKIPRKLGTKPHTPRSGKKLANVLFCLQKKN